MIAHFSGLEQIPQQNVAVLNFLFRPQVRDYMNWTIVNEVTDYMNWTIVNEVRDYMNWTIVNEVWCVFLLYGTILTNFKTQYHSKSVRLNKTYNLFILKGILLKDRKGTLISSNDRLSLYLFNYCLFLCVNFSNLLNYFNTVTLIRGR